MLDLTETVMDIVMQLRSEIILLSIRCMKVFVMVFIVIGNLLLERKKSKIFK